MRPGRSSSNVFFVCHGSVGPLALGDDIAIASSQMAVSCATRAAVKLYDWLKASRFADKYIRANYDVVPMTGKRGGGFIFDTNAIHKGT